VKPSETLSFPRTDVDGVFSVDSDQLEVNKHVPEHVQERTSQFTWCS
jgi:hypothetical protein